MGKCEKILKKLLKKNDINFDYKIIRNIEVAFTDIAGLTRSIVISKVKFLDAINNGLKCDGSSIGEREITFSDMEIRVDKDSIYILPDNNLMVFADTNYKYDARKNLLSIERTLLSHEKTVNIGVEIELFLTHKNNECDDLGYFQIGEEREFDCLNDIMDFCEKVNFPIESFHHECGHGQFEINFKFNSPHKTADNIVYLKRVIEYFANKHDLIARFSPKPFDEECGSGMHTNISIFQDKVNLFFDSEGQFQLSSMAYSFAKGIMSHIEALAAISNPTEESYKRLNYGSETPKNIEMCVASRNSLIRVPIASENSKRIEFRLPDASANPYLLFCAIIISGFDNSTSVREQRLPKDLKEAKTFLKQDTLLRIFVPRNYFD